MAAITTKDGTLIYYKDWGTGQPVLFIHGWPLNSDMWEYQMTFLASQGYRCIAYDRRGFGRSSQPWSGYDYDTLADDLATLIESADLHNVVLVGHSMGGGEVARYIGRHGTRRIAKAVLLSSVTPILIKRPDHPEGADPALFHQMRTGILNDRPQFFIDFGKAFTGANRAGAKVSHGILGWTLFMTLQASLNGTLACIDAFAETDFRPDLKAFDVPTLVIHGDDDQTVPIDISSKATAKAISNARLEVYPGGSHALYITEKAKLDADLLAFLRT